jgi:transcriptional regulator with XRE-family HTH domain
VAKFPPNKRLQHERELRGWTRNYVAEQLGSDPRTIARWERGSTFPSPQLRQKLCRLFNMNAEQLGLLKEDQEDDGTPSSVPQKTPIDAGHTPPLLEIPTAHEDQEDDGTPSSVPQKTPIDAGHTPPLLEIPTAHQGGEKLSTQPQVRQHDQSTSAKPDLTKRLLIAGLLITVGLFILLAPLAQRMAIPIPNLAGITMPIDKNLTIVVKPGGLWISPKQGEIVKDVIHFAAHAYPTNIGDPMVDHVNFTMKLPDYGSWQISCTAHAYPDTDIFACDTSLAGFHAGRGLVVISFDVYDVAGNHRLAPHGERTIMYTPDA